MQLENKVALVTGAALRIGRAIALALGEAGCDVALHYGRSREEAEETAAEIRKKGVQVEPIKADLRVPDEIDALFSKLEERFQRLDVLVNSAASFKRQEFEAIEVPEWDAVQAVNLRAPFLCIQRAADLMRRSPRPGEAPALVVNMVDLSGIYPWLGYAHHGVSKAGLLHLTTIAARELAPDVRVNAVVPGPILPPPGLDTESPAWRRHGEKIPLQRTGDPLQIGETVVFLARNDFITGESIFVDGGEHLLGAESREG